MIAPSAHVAQGVEIPESSVVWDGAKVMHGCKIGEHVSIGGGSEIGAYSLIGEGSRIGFRAFLPNRTVVGRNVFIGPGAILCDDKDPVAGNRYTYKPNPPVLEDGCSIGAGAIILPGVIVGKYARVGAGSIVTSNVPPDCTVRNEPARVR